jgi:ATP-dependent DNA ligase
MAWASQGKSKRMGKRTPLSLTNTGLRVPRKKKNRSAVNLGSEGMPKPLPREFKPMLVSPWTESPEGPDWICEVKWDGYRAVAIIEHSKIRLLSSNGLSLEKG